MYLLREALCHAYGKAVSIVVLHTVKRCVSWYCCSTISHTASYEDRLVLCVVFGIKGSIEIAEMPDNDGTISRRLSVW